MDFAKKKWFNLVVPAQHSSDETGIDLFSIDWKVCKWNLLITKKLSPNTLELQMKRFNASINWIIYFSLYIVNTHRYSRTISIVGDLCSSIMCMRKQNRNSITFDKLLCDFIMWNAWKILELFRYRHHHLRMLWRFASISFHSKLQLQTQKGVRWLRNCFR